MIIRLIFLIRGEFMTKLFYILPQIPIPPDDGGKQAMYYRIKELSKMFELHLSLVDIACTGIEVNDVELALPDVKSIKILLRMSNMMLQGTIFSKMRAVKKWFFSGKPRCAQTFENGLQRQKITEYILKGNFDIVGMDFPYMLELIDLAKLKEKNIRVCCTLHNVEHLFYKDLLKELGIPKILANIEVKRCLSYELNAIKEIDSVASISSYDADYFNDLLGRERVKYIPMYLDRKNKTWKGQVKKVYVLFPGSLNFLPNLEGMLWYCRQVIPQLGDDHFHVTVKVTGKVTPDIREKFKQWPDLEILGYVDDDKLQRLYDECSFAVIPIRSGSGIKMKLLDCISRGVPVLTTNIGAQGLISEDGIVEIADDAAEFSRRMENLISDMKKREMLSENGYQYFVKKFTGLDCITRWKDFFEVK